MTAQSARAAELFRWATDFRGILIGVFLLVSDSNNRRDNA
jgi:hypothetical protein